MRYAKTNIHEFERVASSTLELVKQIPETCFVKYENVFAKPPWSIEGCDGNSQLGVLRLNRKNNVLLTRRKRDSALECCYMHLFA